MTRPEENQNQNTLASWATGKFAMFAIGLAVGVFLYKAGILQKITDKVFKRE